MTTVGYNGIFPIVVDNNGSCWVDNLDGSYDAAVCPATRPRVVPTSPLINANNPFGVGAYSAGNLATVTVNANDSATPAISKTLLYLAAGLVAFFVLKK